MTTFNNIDLFSSGPHDVQVGGLSLRHVLHEPASGDGVQLAAHGRHGRAVTQSGTLVADTPELLESLAAAVEAMLDGRAHDLLDPRGVAWPNVVMLSFDRRGTSRLGTRHQLHYRIQYLQVTP